MTVDLGVGPEERLHPGFTICFRVSQPLSEFSVTSEESRLTKHPFTVITLSQNKHRVRTNMMF